MYTTENQYEYILGVDIGGSHITAGVIDVKNKSILDKSYVREHLDTNASANEIVEKWATGIKKSITASGQNVSKVGLALPGPFDYLEGVSFIKNQGKYENLYNLNVKKMLAKELVIDVKDIEMENDAVCFLKGELFVSDSLDNSNVLGITLGTGLGSVVSQSGVAKDAALWCSPFKEGIAEDYISTRWFISRYAALSGTSLKDVKQICELGDEVLVEKLFKEFSDNLLLFLKTYTDRFSCQAVIIGGNISKAAKHFLPALSPINMAIKIAALGEESALIGAASCFLK